MHYLVERDLLLGQTELAITLVREIERYLGKVVAFDAFCAAREASDSAPTVRV